MTPAVLPIPLVDLRSDSEREPELDPAIVDHVRAACEDTGFFVVTGHAVREPVIERIYRISRTFFDLPESSKRRVGESGSVSGGMMYFPLQAENLAASRGEQRPADLKESLDYGPGFFGDEWPADPPGLRDAWLAYFAAMDGLAAQLRRIFARAIGAPPQFFDPLFDDHLSSLRVLNYPDQPQPPLPGQLRAGAHTDYGFLTILWSEDAPGGLQLQNRAGHWVDVPAVPGAFVVNIGDALMRWTNDRWVSTPHRVVNPPRDARGSCRRQSIAFFHNPSKDAIIRCLEAFAVPGVAPKHPPIAYGDYARLKYLQSHGKAAALTSVG